MEGPITFTHEDRKKVFEFFENLLRDFSDPLYYEYIRGHVSKAPPVVRRYVASKCKGEKLLDYFCVRKNYFIVEGTDVLLRKEPPLRRKRGQSESTTNEISRGRKSSRKRDKSKTKRSFSCCSAVSNSSVTSTCASYNNADENLLHGDYVNKYFNDLLTRHDKVNLSSLDYDVLPKKVKRHLDLYYKKKVVNYFASFPNKFSIDDEGEVTINLCYPDDSSDTLEENSLDTSNSSNSASENSFQAVKKSTPSIALEIRNKYNYIDAVIFFVSILVKKNTPLTVHQLGGYLSQAPKEMREFLKFNYKTFKNFFEENSLIFLLNSSEEVTLAKSSRSCKFIIEQIRRVVSKALAGVISIQAMMSDLDNILHPKVETIPNSEVELDINKESNSETIDTTVNLPTDQTANAIVNSQQKTPTLNVPSEVTDYKSRSIEINDKKQERVATEKILKFPNTQKPSQIEIESKCLDTNSTLCKRNPFTKIKDDHVSSMESMDVQSSGNKFKVDRSSNKEYKSQYSQEDVTFDFLLTIELFCLEMTEKDFDFTVIHEVKAIEYFIEVLNQPLKIWNVNGLHGTLGKAAIEVSSFLNKKYKGEKLLSFFQEQPEFEVNSSFVMLAPSYQEVFSRRVTALSASVNKNSKWDLYKLYKSKCFNDFVKETVTFLYEICHFLQNKSKTKLSRLEGIATRFPNCLEWIKSLEEETLAKKTGNWLRIFNFFEFFEDYVCFPQTLYNDYLMNYLHNAHTLLTEKKVDSVPYFVPLKNTLLPNPIDENFNVNSVDFSESICNIIKTAIVDRMSINYRELVGILPKNLLLRILDASVDSRIIINALLKSGLYFLQNGKIFLKTNQNGSVHCENVYQNKVVNKYVMSISKISISPDETEAENSPDVCNKRENISSSEKPLDISHNENILFDSSIPKKLSQSPSLVKSHSDLNDYDMSSLEFFNDECGNYKSQTTDLKRKENESTCSLEDIKISSLNKSTNEADSTSFVSDCIKKWVHDTDTEIYCDSFDVLNHDTCNQIKHSNETECSTEEFDPMVAESVSALCEIHSFSNLEEEDFTFSEEENMHASTLKEASDEMDFVKEDCISGNFLESERERHSTKTVIADKSEIRTSVEQYIGILNENDEINAMVDTNGDDASVAEKALNQPLLWSQAQLVKDIVSTETEIKLPDKPNVSTVLNNSKKETDYTNMLETPRYNINEHFPENTSEMKCKAELLAKELLQNGFPEVRRSRIFVASTTIIFGIKKKDLLKTYGPFELKCTKKNNILSKPVNEAACDTIKIQDSSGGSLSNLNPTVNRYFNPGKDTEEDWLRISDCTNNSDPTMNMSLNDSKDILDECSPQSISDSTTNSNPTMSLNNVPVESPLQGDFDSTNNLEINGHFSLSNGKNEHVDYPFLEQETANNLNSTENLSSNNSKSVPGEYPLQPISAEIVLLTSDSCIAVAKIGSRKQNIYFLKCVFVCDDQYCCSDCFSDLKIGDIVSCFVPPTEVSRKMWIAFMVSKETSNHFDEIDSFNEVLRKQNDGGSMNHNLCVNSKSVLTQTENSCVELGCQTESSSTGQACQTHLSGDVKLCAITKESMCQTNSAIKSASTQTVLETNTRECQTEIVTHKVDVESQTHHTGKIKEISISADMLCQTELTGEVRFPINTVDTECQTISTGIVMITKYYHL